MFFTIMESIASTSGFIAPPIVMGMAIVSRLRTLPTLLYEVCSKVNSCKDCKFNQCNNYIRYNDLMFLGYTPLNYNVKRLSKNIRQYKRKLKK